MRNGRLIKLLLLLQLIMLSGCFSLFVHKGMPMAPYGSYDSRLDSPSPVYGGTVNAAKASASTLLSPVEYFYSEDYNGGEILLFPLCVIDIPLSFISDTIFLPTDIVFWPKWTDRERLKEEHSKKREECFARASLYCSKNAESWKEEGVYLIKPQCPDYEWGKIETDTMRDNPAFSNMIMTAP